MLSQRISSHAIRIEQVVEWGLQVADGLAAAHAKGIAACWVCAPLFCPQVVHRTLDLPLGYVAHVLLALGPLPSEVPPPRPPYQLTLLHR